MLYRERAGHVTATFSICGWAVLYRFGAEIGPPTFSAFSFGAHMTATFLLALLVGFDKWSS